MADILHSFYTSKPWRELAYRLKVERGGKCAHCEWIALNEEDFSHLIGHHKEELTEANVYDADVALNPDKIEIICFDCHNKEHRRFGHSKHVYIVWGSPLSGKNTAVRQMMQRGDIVLDMDALWQAVTLQPAYEKPDNCRYNIFALRDNLLDQIKTRYGQWYDAYVIGGYPEKYERERLADMLGAETIYVESTKEECLRRRVESGRPKAWDGYIEEWWRVYERGGMD